MFGIIFTVEILFKLFALGRKFVYCKWNMLDSFVVLAWLVDKATGGYGVNPMILRLIRLCKIGRLIKVFHYVSAFDALQVLIGSIAASVPLLVWSGLLLLLLMVTTATFIIS